MPEISVTTLRVQSRADGTTRTVVHFWYTGWPDHGVPSSTATFLRLLHLVNEQHERVCAANSSASEKPRSPILVHCSAGIGRTGVFIAVDGMVKRFLKQVRHWTLLSCFFFYFLFVGSRSYSSPSSTSVL